MVSFRILNLLLVLTRDAPYNNGCNSTYYLKIVHLQSQGQHEILPLEQKFHCWAIPAASYFETWDIHCFGNQAFGTCLPPTQYISINAQFTSIQMAFTSLHVLRHDVHPKVPWSQLHFASLGAFFWQMSRPCYLSFAWRHFAIAQPIFRKM